MLDIIICEEDSNQRKLMKDIISTEIIKSNLNLNLKLVTDCPNKVIRHVENSNNKVSIYFMDIEFKNKINGIELSKKIRKYDPKGYIIFVTSRIELTLLTFQYKVQALDFIIKNNLDSLKSKIIECIHEAYNDFKNIIFIERNVIPINLGNRIVNFNLNDVLFFETTNKDHKIRIHTCQEQLEFYGTLKELEKKVSLDFYKPHRSYLVNIKRIKIIDKENLIIHMENGEVCYIAARFLKGLLLKCLF
ncbi:MAG: LytR/AlgR family response regulator transcription factor [Clostridiaceae bacterium]